MSIVTKLPDILSQCMTICGRSKELGEQLTLERTRSRTVVDKHKAFRPRRSSSVTKLKCKERDWLLYSRVTDRLEGMSE